MPLFPNEKGGPVEYDFVLSHIKDLARLLGLDPELFAGHSLRRGGAQALYDAGYSADEIKKFGGWKSDCFLIYLDLTSSSVVEASELMAKTHSEVLRGKEFND